MASSELARIIPTLLVIFGLSMNSVNNVWAYDDQGAAVFWGDDSCGQLSENIKKGQAWEVMYEAYVQGFVTGINASVPGKDDFFAGTDSASRFKFVTKYCDEHPLERVASALSAMVKAITGKNMQHLAPQQVKNSKHEM